MSGGGSTSRTHRDNGEILTAYIINEPYGDIRPSFVEHFIHKLGREFILIDAKSNRHKVKFNQNIEHPFLTEGWINLREFYGWNEDKMIFMKFLGNDCFQFTAFRGHLNVNSLPSWHTYKQGIEDLNHYEMILTPYMAAGYQLTLNIDFGDYIRSSGFSAINMYGPTGTEYKCDVLIRDGKKKATKIGSGWNKFCKDNGFHGGDKLKFKFVDISTSNVMKVSRI